MYWPIGTPRIYATSSSQASATELVVSYDGLGLGLLSPIDEESDQPTISGSSKPSLLDPNDNHPDLRPPNTPLTPLTPFTPATPKIRSVDEEVDPLASQSAQDNVDGSDRDSDDIPDVPLKDPILALRLARSGQLFAVITRTSITVWQTKVCKLRSLICIRDT